MIRDRGNIKWTSLMLPEHVSLLRKFANEEYYDEPESLNDEQHSEEMDNLIAESMEFTFPLLIQFYRSKRMHVVLGFVHFVDEIKKQLRVLASNGQLHTLTFTSIKNVTKV
ncbi:YolD-like family protein [Peribacillus kribbensis]|uniref:YolD-like family protein n=1 Tax=Peribacillus kribbensis TaxID=356658 RepID=UPI0004786ACE|nr:YolD-like family protein [Peribacillus kribbensis]